MHVLITSDTVGGVWTYTQELVTGLIHVGHRVTLVSFGKLPLPHQTAWMQTLDGLDYRPTEYRLEWMEVAEKDIEESKRYLELLIEEVQPDILHFSQYCYGNIETDIPKIVVAHSDIVSWWVAVHRCEPEDTPWMRRYRETVTNGLLGANVVSAPSQWMLDQAANYYVHPANGVVIHNGRSPEWFDSHLPKQDFVLTVGRVWDAAKQVSLLLEREQEARVCVVGWEREPGREAAAKSLQVPSNVDLLGPKSQVELRDLYSTAAIYAATSRYEPFGLSPLEAAFSRCALVMNDNAVFHELWGDSALYFRKNDSDDLARLVTELRQDPTLRADYADRAYQRARLKFTGSQMVTEYEKLYSEIAAPARVG
jgi:glycosyltransferase involved in cell wall biosynthesis